MTQPLPWEWRPEYGLRTVIFPYLLAVPIWLLKQAGMDYDGHVLVTTHQLVHCVWLVIADLCFMRLSRRLVGKEATSIAMILYLFNHTFTQQMHRLFSSSYEAILAMISLYHFDHLSGSFDKHMFAVIALQSFSFVIRNTSPIPWVLILLAKAYEKGFWNVIQCYIIGFFVIFLPMVVFSFAADSKFYGGDSWTIVPMNFIRVNVFEGLS